MPRMPKSIYDMIKAANRPTYACSQSPPCPAAKLANKRLYKDLTPYVGHIDHTLPRPTGLDCGHTTNDLLPRFAPRNTTCQLGFAFVAKQAGQSRLTADVIIQAAALDPAAYVPRAQRRIERAKQHNLEREQRQD